MLCAKCQSLWKCSQINCQISVALPHMRVCVCVYACANASVCAVCVVCAQHSTAIQLKSNMQQQSSYPTRRLPRPLASLTPHAPRGNCYKCCLACYVGVCKYVTIITLLAGGVGRGGSGHSSVQTNIVVIAESVSKWQGIRVFGNIERRNLRTSLDPKPK